MVIIKINKDKLKDILTRALKTFIQAFLSAISVDALLGVTDLDTLKKVLISILIAATAAGISAVWNFITELIDKHLAGKGAGTMKLDAFIKKYLGKATDYDGVYDAQCVDLIKLYLKHCFGIKAGSWGNAHAYYDYFNLRPELKANFVRIKNSPKLLPMKGDICVFGKRFSESHDCGHIGIATDKSTLKLVSMYDQNAFGNHDPVRISTYDYNDKHFLGVLRPIHREGIDGATLCKVKGAVNIRRGPGTKYDRVMFKDFTAYQQEQVLANGGKAADNDFPKGMLVEVYESKGSWYKISNTEDMWAHKNYFEELK